MRRPEPNHAQRDELGGDTRAPSVSVHLCVPDEDTLLAFAERLGELAADAWFEGAITLPDLR